jgi:CheY-like chemotaxis protein
VPGSGASWHGRCVDVSFPMNARDGKPLVLVIDDDTALLEITRMGLEGQGFVVATATDGRQALSLLRVLHPDAVVCDLVMPVMDGFAFLRGYRERGGGAPVVAVSAFTSYLAEAGMQGASAGVVKPYDVTELTDLLRDLVSGQARRRAPEASPTDGLRRPLTLELTTELPDESLRNFTERVAKHFGTVGCAISVLTPDRQLWAVGHGIANPAPERSLLPHATVARAALVVENASDSPLFDDPAFFKGTGLRFYAGVPLIHRTGDLVGTLCLLDGAPRRFGRGDLELLSLFGHRVLAALEQREHLQHPEIPLSEFRYLDTVDEQLGIFSRSSFIEVAAVETTRATGSRRRLTLVAMDTPEQQLGEAARLLAGKVSGGVLGRLGPTRLGWLVPELEADEAEHIAQQLGGSAARVVATELERYAGAFDPALGDVESDLDRDHPQRDREHGSPARPSP